MEKVKKLRKEIGLKQGDLAIKLNKTKQNYSNIENGVLKPKNLDKIRQDAIDLMLPVLIKKILAARDELERLETFSLQFKINKF